MSIATSYRLARGVGAALALFAAIAVMWWAGRGGPPQRVAATGTIEEVFDSTAAGDRNRIARIRLEDGREARVILPMFALQIGREIPLVIEVYHDGDEAVIFDAERWMVSAGS